MNEVILFTIDCPKCKVLEKKLNAAGITYRTVRDVEEMKEVFHIDTDNTFFPLLRVTDSTGNVEKMLEFKDAVSYINNLK